MAAHRRWYLVAVPAALLALAEMGCESSGISGGTFTREAKLDGMTCTLSLKSAKNPELSWAVTDRVIATFGTHRIDVEKRQVTFDNRVEKLPNGVVTVAIDVDEDKVAILADGKPLFAAKAP